MFAAKGGNAMSLAKEPAALSRGGHHELSGRARTLGRRTAWTLALLLVSGCGLVIDADRQQCKTADECATALGGAAANYTCTEGLCLTSAPRCTAETLVATCGDSPTVQCVDGQCKDEVWGCWNEPDNRPATTQATASLRLKFVSIFGTPPDTLSIVACRSPTIDPLCGLSIPGTSPSYDSSTGLVTVAGIPLNSIGAYRIKVDALPEAGLRPLDYYENRPPHDSDPPSEVTLIPNNVLQLLPGNLNVDPTKGNIVVRVNDCLGKRAAGVRATIADPPSDLGTLYLDSASQLSDLTETSTRGTVNLYNVPVDASVNLVVTISPTKQLKFPLRAFGDRLSLVDLYPRQFE